MSRLRPGSIRTRIVEVVRSRPGIDAKELRQPARAAIVTTARNPERIFAQEIRGS